MDSLDSIETQSVHFFDEKIEQFRSLLFQSLSTMQMEGNRTKEAQVVVIWFSCFSFIPETVDCTISQ